MPKKVVLLLQKDVVDRIIARDKKESILSISVKAYGKPVYIKKVGKKYFSPAPRVDSAILSIENISKKNFTSVTEDTFFEVLRSGFAHKRKLLKNNLNVSKNVLNTCNIIENARAENVSLSSWFCLAKHL